MSLTSQDHDKIKLLKELATGLKDYADVANLKVNQRAGKAHARHQLAEISKGGGLGILTGIVTKFKKAHKPKNEATKKAVQQYKDAIESAHLTAKTSHSHLDKIGNSDHLKLEEKTIRQNLLYCKKAIDEAEETYQTAKKKELEIYKEFMQYLSEKEAMKEGDKKEYKQWKANIEETIKELSKK